MPVTITEPTDLTGAITAQTNVDCNGNATGSVTVAADAGSGTAPYLYSIDGGATQVSETFSGLAEGSYTVTIVDDNGCTEDIPVTITEPDELTGAITSQTDLGCNGNTTGEVTVAADAGTGTAPYLYSIDGGATQVSGTFSGLAEGSYTVTILDDNGCTEDVPVTITEPTELTGAITAQTNVDCNGNSTGEVTVAADVGSGTAPYLYSIDGGVTTQVSGTFSGLAEGSYTVTIVDDNGCTEDVPVTITEPTELTGAITAQTNVDCNGNATGSVTVAADAGTGTASYLYSIDGGATQVSGTFSGLAEGAYTVTIVDDNGCTEDVPVTITEPTDLTGAITAQTNVDCNGNATGSVTVAADVGSGTAPYLYSIDGGATQVSETFSGLAEGSYTVTIVDDNGCTEDVPVIITEPATIFANGVITDNLCWDQINGSITQSVTGGSGPYSFSWMFNGSPIADITQNLTNIDSGSYTVTIIDSELCTYDTTYVISTPSIIYLNGIVTNVDCNGASTGSIDINPSSGVAPYSFDWDHLPPGGYVDAQNLTLLPIGTYNVSIMDGNGCVVDSSMEVTENPLITGVLSSTNSSCIADDGTITAVISGGAGGGTYSWTNTCGLPSPVGGYTVTGLAACCYDLTYTDAVGCIYTDQVCVMDAIPSTGSFVTEDLTCFESCDGSITSSINGGTLPYVITWTSTDPTFVDPGTANIFSLCAGDYTITVTDASSCILTETLTINEPNTIVAGNTVVPDIQCFGDTDGSIDISAAGGVVAGPYAYSWTGPGFTSLSEDISGLAAGEYCVNISDDRGCSIDTCIIVSEPTSLTATYTTNNAQCGSSDGDATIVPSGGTPFAQPAPDDYTYNWYTILPNNTISVGGLGAGIYPVEVSDANGCVDTVQVTISEDNSPTIVVDDSTLVSCFGICDGAINTTVTSATPFTLSWTGPGGYSSALDDISSLCVGTYTLTATDNITGCQVFRSVEITEPTVYDLLGVVTQPTCFDSLGLIDITITGGTAPYTFDWDNDGTGDNDDVEDLEIGDGTYVVNGLDANGCVATGSFTVITPAQGTSSTSSVPSSDCVTPDGSVSVIAGGGTPGPLPNDYTYLWTNTSTGVIVGNTATVTGLIQGCYNVTITDGNSCPVTDLECFSPAVEQPITYTQTDANCFGAAEGTITITSVTSGDSLFYTSGPTVIPDNTLNPTGLLPGQYTVEDTEDGCVSSAIIDILGPADAFDLPGVVTQPTCFDSLGLINITPIGGTGPYTVFDWDNDGTGDNDDTEDLEIEDGTYVVIGVDANGCAATGTFTITEPSQVTASTSSVPSTDCFTADGSVSVIAGGGTPGTLPNDYTYSWTSALTGAVVGNTPTVSALLQGCYNIEVTDVNDCPVADAECISSLSSPPITFTQTDVTCFGASDGSISITSVTSGDSLFYTSGPTVIPNNTLNPTGLSPGQYTVEDTKDGCISSVVIDVLGPLEITLAEAIIHPLCAGELTGEIDITAANNIGITTFAWTGPNGYVSTDEDLTGLEAGEYCVTLTDGNGCQAAECYDINSIPALTLNGSSVTASCAGNDGEAMVAASGGTPITPSPEYTYQWYDPLLDPLGTADTETGLVEGIYVVEVTDGNGCIESIAITVSREAVPAIVVDDSTMVSCFGVCDGNITTTVTGINPFTLSWSGPGSFSSSLEDLSTLCSGIYILTATDNITGCQDIRSVEITEPAIYTLSGIIAQPTCSDSLGLIDVTPSGGTGPNVFDWDNDGTGDNDDAEDLEIGDGTYIVNSIDANGCIATGTFTVTAPTQITALTSSVPSTDCVTPDGSVSVVAGGGTPGSLPNDYTYLWSNSSTGAIVGNTANVSGLLQGCYNVIVTDGNGCPITDAECIISLASAPITYTHTDVTCFGDSDGSITITSATSGDSLFYTSGPTVIADNTINPSGLLPGQYTVEDTEDGCVSSVVIDVLSPLEITLTAVLTNPICASGFTGEIDLIPTDNIGITTFAWTGPNGYVSTNEDITGLEAGQYCVTVTDGNGCQATECYNLNDNPVLSLTTTSVPVTCAGNDGEVTVIPDGGVAPYAIDWDFNGIGLDNANETGLTPLTTVVTVTDDAGCIVIATETVTNPSAPVITLVAQTDVTCFGDNDGSIVVNVSGGTAPYVSFLWSQSGVITQDLTNSGPIHDTLTVIDSDGCISTYIDSILEPSALSISGLENNVLCLGAMDGSIDITVDGGTPFVLAPEYNYSWTSTNSGFVPTPTLTEDLVAIDTGTYTVVATDSNGCTISDQYTISQPDSMLLSFIVVIDSCFQEGAGEIDITVTQGTGPYNYSWTALLPTFTPTSDEDITNLVADTYNLTIVDDNGCQKDTSFVLTESPQIIADVSVIDANCLLSNGAAFSNASGGVAPYTYDWDAISTGTDTTNVPSGTYNLGVIGAFGCRLDTIITINDIAAPTITIDNITDVTCFGSQDGSADVTITGTAPFTYLWNSNAISQLEDLANAPAGDYIYQVTDAAGCVSFETITIGSPAEITGTSAVIDATCGICDGEATITALGGIAPYAYNWSDGQTTATADSLCPGVQTVQITDFNNCVVNVNVSVSDNGGPTSYTMNEVDVTCDEGTDGSAEVNATGGTLPYSYLWIHDGNTSSLASNLEAGTYNVEITDSDGCVLIGEANIGVNTVISSTAYVTPSTCGGSDGAIEITATGGTGTYSYVWSPGAGTGQDTTGAAEGTYTLTIDDGNCQIEETFAIPGMGAPGVALQIVESNCYDDNTGSISAAVTNSVGVLTYEWFNGATSLGAAGPTSAISSLAPGTYTVEVFDPGTGCFAYGTGIINSPDTLLFSSPTLVDASCGGGCDGEAYAVVSGGTLPYTYSWSGNPSSSSTASNLCVGADTVIITDANLCIVVSEVILNEPSAISIVVDSITDAYCVNSTAGAIYITASGGSVPYTYNWASIPPSGFVDPGVPFITDVLPMNYEISVTDDNGCVYIDTIGIDTLNTLISNAGIDTSFCFGGCVDLIGTVIGATNYSVEWMEVTNGVSNTLSITDTLLHCPLVAALDTLVFVATDLNCSSADTIEVLTHSLPVVDAGPDYLESYGTPIVIGGSPTSGYGPYQWTPTTNFTDTSGIEANPELIVLFSQNYVVTVTDTNGCVNSDTVYVELLPEIIFPNGFSPNGDGINDTWQLDLMTDFPECVIEVYNRWGQQLFISIGDLQQFDGRYKGKDLPVGTYYYIIVLNHPEYPDAFTGPVTIMR